MQCKIIYTYNVLDGELFCQHVVFLPLPVEALKHLKCFVIVGYLRRWL